MNQALRVSTAANVVLALLALWLVWRAPIADRQTAASGVQITNAPPEVQAAQSATAQLATTALNEGPFRWSQLESTDYRTYLANLRRVGCPEQTIRDILTADVDSLYAPRRERLERALNASFAARPEVEAQLAGLRSEEASSLAWLLGDTTPAPESAAKEPPWVLAKRNARSVMPLVFGNIDPVALQLDQGQMAVINQVRQMFQDEVGAQDHNDPTYRQRWNAAQRNADDMLRGILGSKVYVQYQLQAANRMSR